MIAQILMIILSQIPAPIVEPDGVPFDPSGHSDIVFAKEYEESREVELEIKVGDDTPTLTATCSEGFLGVPDVVDVGYFEFTYLWTHTIPVGMNYIEFVFTDDGSLSKAVTAVLYVPEENTPPIVISITEVVSEPTEPLSWISPACPNSNFVDGDIDTYIVVGIGNSIECTLPPSQSDRLRLYVRGADRSYRVEVYDGTWKEVHTGGLDLGWQTITYTRQIVDRVRITQTGGSNNGTLSEIEVGVY